MRQFDVSLKLQQRTTGLAEEQSKASIGTPALSFGNIGGDRGGGAADLTGEAKGFRWWKIACGQVDLGGHVNRALPDLQVTEVAGSHAFIPSPL